MDNNDRLNLTIFMCGVFLICLSSVLYCLELEEKIEKNTYDIEMVCTHKVTEYGGTNDNMISKEFPNMKCIDMVEFDKKQDLNNKIIIELK